MECDFNTKMPLSKESDILWIEQQVHNLNADQPETQTIKETSNISVGELKEECASDHDTVSEADDCLIELEIEESSCDSKGEDLNFGTKYLQLDFEQTKEEDEVPGDIPNINVEHIKIERESDEEKDNYVSKHRSSAKSEVQRIFIEPVKIEKSLELEKDDSTSKSKSITLSSVSHASSGKIKKEEYDYGNTIPKYEEENSDVKIEIVDEPCVDMSSESEDDNFYVEIEVEDTDYGDMSSEEENSNVPNSNEKDELCSLELFRTNLEIASENIKLEPLEIKEEPVSDKEDTKTGKTMSALKNESKATRKRAKNFTAEEEMLLVYLVESHKHILENKKSDAWVWRQKKEAWKKIAEEFGATIGAHRHYKALRDKYLILRKKSRLDMADQKSETYRTGGGVPGAKVNGVSAKIASMLGGSGTGLQNSIDRDYLFDDENCTVSQNRCESVDEDEMSNVECEENVSPGKKIDWSSWRTTPLKQAVSKEVVNYAKRKRSIEEEKMELILLQQKFYRDENIRAQEKHEQELLSLKLKNEILQLELAEKKNKKSLT